MRKVTKLTNRQMDKAEIAFNRLMKSLPPELAEKVKQKYDVDSKEFKKAAGEFRPSNEPSYWAKKGCGKCYGRGTIGDLYMFRKGDSARSDNKGGYSNSMFNQQVSCSCTARTYQLWLAEFRMFYNALRAEKGTQDVSEE